MRPKHGSEMDLGSCIVCLGAMIVAIVVSVVVACIAVIEWVWIGAKNLWKK